MAKQKKYDLVTPILKDMKWLTIKDQITHDTAVAIFKYLDNHYPDYLFQLPTVSNITLSTIRQRNNLYVPKANTDTGGRSLLLREPKL